MNINESNISFVGADFSDHYLNDKITKKLLKSFNDYNCNFKSIFIIDDRKTFKKIRNEIENSNIIFLLGGDALNQKKYFKKYINENKIVVGLSVGVINMVKRVVLAKDVTDNIPKLSVYRGLA